MGWSWRASSRAGAPVADEALESQEFPTQSDAETWLGEQWPELLERGIDAVSLFEEGRAAYGPMSLHPPE